MKKILLLSAMLFGMSNLANAQEWFVSGVRKGGDTGGYITIGYIKKTWGLYGGLPYGQVTSATQSSLSVPGVNAANGTISGDLKVGVLRKLVDGKFIFGVGIQPYNGANKPNVFLAYNPLKQTGPVNLYGLVDLVGGDARLGAGLSIKFK